MTSIESIALAFNYKNINLFYRGMYDITFYSVILIVPGIMYLRYKKIIKFITMKYLGMTIVLTNVISGCLYNGWSWIYSFYILSIYAIIISTEKEIQKEEQERQNASTLADQPKKEKRKLSRTTKALLIVSIIISLISVILNYFRLINLN